MLRCAKIIHPLCLNSECTDICVYSFNPPQAIAKAKARCQLRARRDSAQCRSVGVAEENVDASAPGFIQELPTCKFLKHHPMHLQRLWLFAGGEGQQVAKRVGDHTSVGVVQQSVGQADETHSPPMVAHGTDHLRNGVNGFLKSPDRSSLAKTKKNQPLRAP